MEISLYKKFHHLKHFTQLCLYHLSCIFTKKILNLYDSYYFLCVNILTQMDPYDSYFDSKLE